jgi:uncharacterized membrane protein YqjE
LKDKIRLAELFNLDGLIEALTKYLDTKSELLKLQLKEQITKIFTSLITAVFTLSFAFFFAFFLSLALGFFLNEWLGSRFYGFLIIAGGYLITGIITYISKDTFITSVIYRLFFKRVLEEDDENEDEYEDDQL